MAVATLNGNSLMTCQATIPAWGRWYVEATLDKEVTLSGAVTVSLPGLELVGHVMSGGPSNGRSRYRVVGGKGGWGQSLPAKAYQDDAGVKASKVLSDAAAASGETLDASTLPATRVGPHWARIKDEPASRVLEQLAPSAWHVGIDGVTRIGLRAATTYKGKAARNPVDLAAGVLTLEPEDCAGLVPGVVVDGLAVVDVLHELDKGKLRTTLWGARTGVQSRRLDAFRRIFDQIDPARKYRGVWEYRVVLLAGTRLDLQPVRVSTGLPELRRVPMAPGVAGAKSTLVPGARVLVAFVDASPARPVVIGFEDSDGEGFTPVLTEIDATTFVKLGAGIKPVIAAGDLAGGIWPTVPTQVKVLV